MEFYWPYADRTMRKLRSNTAIRSLRKLRLPQYDKGFPGPVTSMVTSDRREEEFVNSGSRFSQAIGDRL